MMPVNRRFTTLLLLLASFIAATAPVNAQTIRFSIDTKNKAQTIDNFGASGAWYSENIGKYWPSPVKERMAELLFSKSFDKKGNPLGIGLSAWRFNIGGGTAEQGDSSGIKDSVKRVESFLSADGRYNWNKQQGYKWFVQKAAAYNVENLIAFSNTPPVFFTKNGLGFNLVKNYETNLRDDKYGAYADFLATVLRHFDDEGLHFNYISPVNEPQWDWSAGFGKMNQEGSPWHNRDIFKIAYTLDSVLLNRKLSSKILLPEAATLTALYEGNGHAGKQVQQFFSPDSSNYAGHLLHTQQVVAGHSYFTDLGDTALVSVRKKLHDTLTKYRVPFWQSEYCMLADGYREGVKGPIKDIDCALFLSKVIYTDLVVAQAAAWQFWNAWEPGSPDFNTRYYLLALDNKGRQNFAITKNLWALGHYSRFIRPGMQRIITQRSDSLTDVQSVSNVMVSGFMNDSAIVVVAINYTQQPQQIEIELQNTKNIKAIDQYVTSASAKDNMTPYPLSSLKEVALKARSINTIVLKTK